MSTFVNMSRRASSPTAGTAADGSVLLWRTKGRRPRCDDQAVRRRDLAAHLVDVQCPHLTDEVLPRLCRQCSRSRLPKGSLPEDHPGGNGREPQDPARSRSACTTTLANTTSECVSERGRNPLSRRCACTSRPQTDGDARWSVAVIATRHLEMAARVGELALVDASHPGPENAEGYLVLGLARHRASVATDAPAVVDHEAVAHGRLPLPGAVPSRHPVSSCLKVPPSPLPGGAGQQSARRPRCRR